MKAIINVPISIITNFFLFNCKLSLGRVWANKKKVTLIKVARQTVTRVQNKLATGVTER